MPASYYVYLLTNRYNIGQFVYYEAFNEIHDAIAREKQLKGWTRKKKTALIESANPNWDDLAVTTDMTLQSTT